MIPVYIDFSVWGKNAMMDLPGIGFNLILVMFKFSQWVWLVVIQR